MDPRAVGLPVDADAAVREVIEKELENIGFEAVVDTPRKAMLRLAEEAAVT